MALEIIRKFNQSNNNWVVVPIGEIDIYSSPQFKEALLSIIDDKQIDIVIDGSKLEYIDSTGLGVLISALKKIKENNNNIIIENIKPSIRRLFDLTGLNKVFIIKE